jgi:thymidylate kinase
MIGAMNPPHDHPQPILILIRGLPGSGKTYVAEALRKSLGKENVVMLDPDATDRGSEEYAKFTEALTQDGVDPKFFPYRYLRAQAHEGIRAGKTIIWNQPFTHLDGFNKTVLNLRNYASERQASLPILVVEMELDPALAKARVESRKQAGGHGPTESTFNRFDGDYVSFADQGHKTVTVHGTGDVNASVDRILEALDGLKAEQTAIIQ